MKRLNNVFRYILCLALTLFSLIVLNIFVMAGVQGSFDESKRVAASVSVTAGELKFDSGVAFMSEKGMAKIDALDGFAILIDERGNVIWEYKRPSDVPTTYMLSDVASFSRWYLCDYPVYSYIIDMPTGGRAIFVLGQPKDSLWKYQVTVGVNSLRRYPYIFAADLFILCTVPLLLTKRSSRRRERERTEWIAGISHDIRTPLTMAMLATDKLVRENADSETAATAKQIMAQELRLKGLIENLNADNRMQYCHGKRVREKVALPSMIRDVLCVFADANDGLLYSFEFATSPGAENCVIYADEALVRRLLENLIGNSVRHNPDGCAIIVELRKAGRMLLRDHWLLCIRDNGCGVSTDIVAALNKRSERTQLREHGMGLRVVSHIAREYHWRLYFSSEHGKGFKTSVLIRSK